MSNVTALAKMQESILSEWFEQNPWAAMRGIDQPMWNALQSSVYPGAKPESVLMAVDYCKARGLDIMMKPVHLVPMKLQDGYRDVVMPGVGMYRIQADRSGTYAGADEPEFGPTIEQEFEGQDWQKKPIKVKVRYPEWCKYTVYKSIGDRIVKFTAQEFWLENYATQGYMEAPNAMWKKRPFGQLAKCAEAQALRKGWPEIGQEPTAEEMEGKSFIRDVTPEAQPEPEPKAIAYYPAESFESNFDSWKAAIESGKRTADQIISIVTSKAPLTDDQIQKIKAVEATQ